MTEEEIYEGIEVLHERVSRCTDTTKTYLAKAQYLIDTFITNNSNVQDEARETDIDKSVRISIMADIGRCLSSAMIYQNYDGYKKAAINVYKGYSNTPIDNEYIASLTLVSLAASAHLLSERTLTDYLDVVAAFGLEIDAVINRIFKDC